MATPKSMSHVKIKQGKLDRSAKVILKNFDRIVVFYSDFREVTEIQILNLPLRPYLLDNYLVLIKGISRSSSLRKSQKLVFDVGSN